MAKKTKTRQRTIRRQWYLRGIWRASATLQRRILFITGGVVTGLAAYSFATLADIVQGGFQSLTDAKSGYVWLITPLGFALSAVIASRWFPNSQGSGIPQCIAAMQTTDSALRHRLLSARIAFGKFALTLLGLACGASIGREGPTVHVGASIMVTLGGVMHREPKGLILAGSAAGIAAAFNAPLAGIVFTIEELSRSFEARTSGLILTATIIAGLVATELAGNYAYFGYASGDIGGWIDWLALLITAVAGGALGGLFSRFIIAFSGQKRLQDMVGRNKYPVLFALGCGAVVAGCGALSGDTVFGTGYREAYDIIHAHAEAAWLFVPLKMIATTLSSISGIPGGLFSPSLSIGAGIGSVVSQILPVNSVTQFALLGMAAYLTGVVQSPITSVVIMAEMTDNHSMVVPLLACSLIADWVSKRISPHSIYHGLTGNFMGEPSGPGGPASTAAKAA
jgi:H+/Cl- antiporter ClcA